MRLYYFFLLIAMLALPLPLATQANDVMIDLPELPALDKELLAPPKPNALPPLKVNYLLTRAGDLQEGREGEVMLFVTLSRALSYPSALTLESEGAQLEGEKTYVLQAGLHSLQLPLKLNGKAGATVSLAFESQQQTLALPIKNCAREFTQSLNRLETTHRAPLYQAYVDVKKPDETPTPTPFFTAPSSFTATKDGKEAMRLYGLLRARNGSDPIFLTTNILGDSLNRSLGELKGFLMQKETPGICSGLPEFLGFYKTRLKEFQNRSQFYETSIKLGLAHINATKKQEEGELTLETLNEAFAAPKLTPALAFVKTLQQGQARFKSVETQVNAFFGAIETAHKQTCSCVD